MPGLFDSFLLKEVTLRNRIVASPMCQYSAEDGFVNKWHQTHYTTLSQGGAGLVMLEATAVARVGRITPGDLGIWSDEHISGLALLAAAIKRTGAIPGIQLAHAGRKAGCTPPWEGSAPLLKSDPRAWTPIGPSPLPHVPSAPHIPTEMTAEDIEFTQKEFVVAAQRALTAGFEWVELHFAHGYLGQNFLSTQSNIRTDRYGGSLENRARFLVETVEAVRKVWPQSLPLTARLGAVAFEGTEEVTLDSSISVVRWLKAAGLDFVDVGLAHATGGATTPWRPNLMVPYTERVRQETGLPVGTSWLITDAQEAEAFIREEKMDLVFLGRSLLANPHWPYQAARELNIKAPENVLPVQYAYWLKDWKPQPHATPIVIPSMEKET